MRKVIPYIFLFIIIVAITLGAYLLFFKTESETQPSSFEKTSPIKDLFKKEPETIGYKDDFGKDESISIEGFENRVTVQNFYKNAVFVTKRGDAEIKSPEEYTLSYIKEPSYFIILITSDDVPNTIRKAEEEFLSLLKINRNMACELDVRVAVEKSFDLDRKYLKPSSLSFCPPR